MTRHLHLLTKIKKTAWEPSKFYDDVTAAVEALSHVPPEETTKEVMHVLEQFVVLIYGVTGTCSTVSRICTHLITLNGWAIVAILPTSVSLLQHVKHAVYR